MHRGGTNRGTSPAKFICGFVRDIQAKKLFFKKTATVGIADMASSRTTYLPESSLALYWGVLYLDGLL